MTPKPTILKFYLRIFLFSFIFFPLAGFATNVDSLQQLLLKLPADTTRLSVLQKLGDHYFRQQPDSALIYVNHALTLSQQLEKEEDLMKLQMLKGTIYYNKNDILEAMKNYRQAISTGEKLKLPKIGLAYDNLGLCFSIQRQPDSAIYFHRKSIQAARLQQNHEHLGIFVGHLGLVYANMSELDSAQIYFEQALHYLELANSTHRANIARINLALLLSDQGEHEKALDQYFKSLDYFEQAKDKRMLIQSFGSIGLIYHQLEQPEKAIEYHQKAVLLNKESAVKSSVATFQLDLASIYLERKEMAEASRVLADARAGFNAINDQMGMAESDFLEGKLKESQGHLEQAITFYTDALIVFQKYNNSSKLSDLLAKMALAYEKLNASGKVSPRFLSNQTEQLLLQADSLAQRSKQFDSKRNALLSLAAFYKARKDFAKAFQYQEGFLALSDSIYNRDRMALISEMETKYETKEKEKQNELLQLKTELVQEQNKRYVAAMVLLTLLLLGLIYLFIQLNKTKNKLSLSNSTKDQLFSIIAHDLRGAASNFKGIGKIIQYHLQNNNQDRLKKMAEEITHSATKLSSLLDNLLQWSLRNLDRIEINPINLSLNDYVESNIQLMEEFAQAKDIQLSNQLDRNFEVHVDPDSLSLVLRNLLGNALKYSKPGDQVIIRAEESNGFVKIDIIDSGIGIPADKLKTIFQMDRQKSSPGTSGERGSGIGLALSNDFVTYNQGTLEISSTVGAGTTCTLRLPKAV